MIRIDLGEDTMSDKIRYYYDTYIYTPYRIVIESCFNLFFWFKIISKDRNWDHNFFYIILQFKLKRMIIYFEKEANCGNGKHTAKYMKICVSLIDTILKDDFIPDYLQTKGNNICKVNMWEIERRRKQKYINLLFKIISKKSMTWWD